MRNHWFALFFACLVSAASADTRALFSATLHDVNDKAVALAQYKGQALIVNFWARWCAPCRDEIPEFNRLNAVHRGKLKIIGIGIEDDANAVKTFVQKYQINYPILIAREQGIPLMQGLENTRGGLPFTVVIDRHGKIVQTRLGLMRQADLDQAATLALRP